MDFISHSLNETIQLGKMFARGLKAGSVVLARGELGAGKTAFAKGLALGLGIKQIVNSPTFNIMKVYFGKELKLYHIDAYRLEDPAAVSDIGFDEAIGNKDGIAFIEWPDFIASYFSDEQLVYSVSIREGKNSERIISIKEGR
ncbi:MAG: tRNA (adenosine(37)-N6)-threonylcarbamoyltransferase complex ATPase subunit type 1 TsaE [Bacilli bacterium]|jgi:tRNA threonylcarbamoyladenosine biosynthesis protein TsaE|nr:tRNA (adenosine(37)-N6)-threonylcarbamoyltransferase complex ATPase subunit type 1 TsaE [Bacilli bacterium]